MGQVIPIAAARRSSPVCPQCGTETNLPEFGVEALCSVCAPPEPEGPAAPPKDGPTDVIVIGEKALRALEELYTVTETAASRIIEEILALEKQVLTLFAFLPVVGAWRIWDSEYHTAAEKFHLSSLSAAITIVAGFCLFSLLPTVSDHSHQMLRRMDVEMRELRDVAEQYRAQRGHYPDEATWRRFAARADPRFFDPWCRPYRYQADEDTGLTISSLGRDGVVGGLGDKADLSLHFPPAVKSDVTT